MQHTYLHPCQHMEKPASQQGEQAPCYEGTCERAHAGTVPPASAFARIKGLSLNLPDRIPLGHAARSHCAFLADPEGQRPRQLRQPCCTASDNDPQLIEECSAWLGWSGDSAPARRSEAKFGSN